MAQTTCPQLIPDWEVLREKYFPVFTLFARCHTLYDKNYIGSITDLGISPFTLTFLSIHLPFLFVEDAVRSFLSYYRQHFPSASITLKLYLMEENMVPFIGQWGGVGFELLGEQGAESIHHEFKLIQQR